MPTTEEIIKQLLEHKIHAQVVRDNHRNKQLDFSCRKLHVDTSRPDSPGFRQNTVIVFTGKITFDAIEGKVTAWDYDEDGDQAAAEKLKLHSIITKILS